MTDRATLCCRLCNHSPLKPVLSLNQTPLAAGPLFSARFAIAPNTAAGVLTLPVAGVIVLLYFGFVQVHRVLGFALIVAVLLLLVWTSPNRWGAGIALHYLSRIYWPDPADPVPAKRGDDLS